MRIISQYMHLNLVKYMIYVIFALNRWLFKWFGNEQLFTIKCLLGLVILLNCQTFILQNRMHY